MTPITPTKARDYLKIAMEEDKLTDEEIRIKIAEACGWSGVGKRLPKVYHNVKILIGVPPENTNLKYTDWACSPVPDYLKDLNAMHEAEKNLIDTELFIHHLKPILVRSYRAKGKRLEHFSEHDGVFMYAHATARQRAEAFIKTIDS